MLSQEKSVAKTLQKKCNDNATLIAWNGVAAGFTFAAETKTNAVMNKRVFALGLALLLCTGGVSAKRIRNASFEDIVTVTPGAVTFKVEDVKIAEDYLTVKYGADLGRKWANGEPYLGSSFANESLVDGGDNAFFSMVCLAYAQHRPIVLSADIMWIVICNGYSQYVNRDPEKFRKYLVNHNDKETLVIRTDLQTTTAQKVQKFADLIAKETKGDIAEVMTCDFSTTGMIEKMVSQITLMETVKPYFDFMEMLLGCGIPSVTLEGTPDDWKLLREKTRKLGEFGVKEWTDKLDPILEEFVFASEGKPNLKFWWNMAIKGRPLNFHLQAGGGCLPSYGPTPFDGWFLEFIPFDEWGELPDRIPYGHKLPPLMTSVPIIQLVEDDFGSCIGINALELRGGIVGLAQDTATMALRPEIGWLVRNDPTIEFDEDDVRNKARQAKEMGDGDAVIKQGIKKPEKQPEMRYTGARPNYDYRLFDMNDWSPLYLAEFEGWGIDLRY